ncbi:hypothetical protein NPIL_87311 [Nephila pilipes]|uniref:Uncharacterized protein n=1 Tax=Nephila pilipes TaxID=299642 RepID=A0A8X6UE44_NEPPI|nr:hypothetical protein NPIL_87311 [Nephila pilipes]
MTLSSSESPFFWQCGPTSKTSLVRIYFESRPAERARSISLERSFQPHLLVRTYLLERRAAERSSSSWVFFPSIILLVPGYIASGAVLN